MTTPNQPKKIALFLDGTWLSRSEAKVKGLRVALGIEYYSNIALMAQALEPHDKKGVPQFTYYQEGLGTSAGLFRKLFAGATGHGLLDNLVAAYSFLVDNYTKGDEIFLFGFSRGAYTARALSGLIDYAGILKKSKSGFLNPILAAYTRRSIRDPESCRHSAEILHKYTKHWPGLEATERERNFVRSEKPSLTPEDEIRLHWTIPKSQKRVQPVPIKVIGVFDTVGALGIPGAFDVPWVHQQYEFFDTALSGNVQYAYHVLALNEDRADFRPALWTVRADELQPHQVVKQVWFKGSHPDVGGGFYEHGLSDVTLAWMVAQMMDHPEGPQLQFNLDLLKRVQDRTRPWAAQPIHPTRVPVMFRHERQMLQTAPPEERSMMDSAVELAAISPVRGTSDDETTGGVRLQTFEPTLESLHYSVTVGKVVDPDLSSQFRSLRERNPAKLRKLWEQAKSSERLLPTERELIWTETQVKLQPLSIAYGALYGLISPERTTQFQALVELVGALVRMATIVLSFATYLPSRIISFLFTASLSTENLMGVPPKDPREELERAWHTAQMAWAGLIGSMEQAEELQVEPILLSQM
ncbi:hypothetical protein A4X13_0g1919 [Tilletia indica]|uniref:T6SS Phospholipase effector Tle1-like catalytic domain-containing protein n=1 Tax=Tilletia indica TaxID=43049 RepID=A0A177TKF4_9BASI|nr:hypothetical protein A4X13_0g1919 [Tilletia indica]